jgi:hypothetical protein
MPREQRFWAKVEQRGPDECWPWLASADEYGYGRFRGVAASRAAYTYTKGDPGRLLVCHTCDNPGCVNPAHLWLGTVRDNGVDCSQKRRARNQYGGQAATHCINGHEYTPQNTYWRPGKVASRDCRACIRERARRYRSNQHLREPA